MKGLNETEGVLRLQITTVTQPTFRLPRLPAVKRDKPGSNTCKGCLVDAYSLHSTANGSKASAKKQEQDRGASIQGVKAPRAQFHPKASCHPCWR